MLTLWLSVDSIKKEVKVLETSQGFGQVAAVAYCDFIVLLVPGPVRSGRQTKIFRVCWKISDYVQLSLMSVSLNFSKIWEYLISSWPVLGR